MEENKEMTAQNSLKLISETINNSRKDIVSRSGKYFILWGALLTVFSLVVYTLWKSSGNASWNYLWFAMPVAGYGLAALIKSKKAEIEPENYISKLLGGIWSAFGVFAISVSAYTPIFLSLNSNPIAEIAVGISLTAEIILLFGLAECISGIAVKNWAITVAGFITGIGGLAIYSLMGNNSQGIEQMFIFTFAGIVLTLTGVVIKFQNR